jgi:hypothetical protein
MPELPQRLELILGAATQAQTANWDWISSCKLEAPILNFTIKDILDEDFRGQVKNVLKFWINFDVENLVRIKNGIQQFVVPPDYETNRTKDTARTMQGVWRFREDTFQLAKNRLRELMSSITTHCYNNGDGDMVSAVIYAMALRQLSPEGYVPGQFNPHNSFLHTKLNELFGMEQGKPGSYLYQACDLLLKMVTDELARHGRPASGRTFRLGDTVRSAKGRLLINTIDNNPNDPDGPLGTTRGWADCGPAR